MIMYEEAQEILNYLPIRRDKAENDYIDHLWNAFLALDASGTSGRPFVMMPFHLLFMLAMQYKVLRISKERRSSYDLVFMIDGGRDRATILNPGSVFDLALLTERTIPDVFKLIGLDAKTIKQMKGLIDNRNNTLAHAKGGIEADPEARILEYLQTLKNIQNCMKALNSDVARSWLSEITDEDNPSEFVEGRLSESFFCIRDLENIIKDLLEDEKLNNEQWLQMIDKGLEYAYGKTIIYLKDAAQCNVNSGKRFDAINLLNRNGELDDELKAFLLAHEDDDGVIELLKN